MKDVYVVASLFVASLLIVALVRADSVGVVCKIPDPNNTTHCVQMPIGGAHECGHFPVGHQCTGSKQYEIRQFPDGSIIAPLGAVETGLDICYVSQYCIWEPTTGDDGICVPDPDSIPFTQLQYKIKPKHLNSDNPCYLAPAAPVDP